MAAFPDIEAELISALPALTGYPWYSTAPKGSDGPFGTVERTGGPSGAVLDRPTVALQVWGASRASCAELAARLCAAVASLPEAGPIRSASVNSCANFPDYEGGRPRYQVVADLVTVLQP